MVEIDKWYAASKNKLLDGDEVSRQREKLVSELNDEKKNDLVDVIRGLRDFQKQRRYDEEIMPQDEVRKTYALLRERDEEDAHLKALEEMKENKEKHKQELIEDEMDKFVDQALHAAANLEEELEKTKEASFPDSAKAERPVRDKVNEVYNSNSDSDYLDNKEVESLPLAERKAIYTDLQERLDKTIERSKNRWIPENPENPAPYNTQGASSEKTEITAPGNKQGASSEKTQGVASPDDTQGAASPDDTQDAASQSSEEPLMHEFDQDQGTINNNHTFYDALNYFLDIWDH